MQDIVMRPDRSIRDHVWQGLTMTASAYRSLMEKSKRKTERMGQLEEERKRWIKAGMMRRATVGGHLNMHPGTGRQVARPNGPRGGVARRDPNKGSGSLRVL